MSVLTYPLISAFSFAITMILIFQLRFSKSALARDIRKSKDKIDDGDFIKPLTQAELHACQTLIHKTTIAVGKSGKFIF